MSIAIREATPQDALAVARVHVRSWQVAYRGVFADDFLDALRPEDRASRYRFGVSGRRAPRTVLALEAGAVIGFATTGPSRDQDVADAGELYALYVDPDAWRSGVGRLLMQSAYEQMRTLGAQRAILWVLAANERAQRFYGADGWSPDGASREEDVWDVPAFVVRYARKLG